MADKTGEFDLASPLFDKAVSRAVSRQLLIGELFTVAVKLKELDRPRLAADIYKTWIAHNPDDPVVHAAYFNFGIALNDIGDRAGAINAFREATRLKPDFFQPYINLGRSLEDAGAAGAALAAWSQLTERLGSVNGDTVAHKCMALQQIGRVLEELDKDEAAETALKQSLDINIAQPEVIQHWLALRQRQCKWPVIAEWDRGSRRQLAAGISPLSLANLADDPMFQLARAWRYGRTSIGLPKGSRTPPLFDANRTRGSKLKIGYVSSDLREHAVGFSLTEVMELHDRSAFEIHAYYCGIPREDPTRVRIRGAVDHWTDINGLDDETAAAQIAADGIDIVVDLNGYTKSARTKVFAWRPAPIAVNWFGFPGTMGTPYHHYIIADERIIPPSHEIYYSEKVLRLACYQPNDRRRVVAEKPPRSAEGLPEDAFVFCCLNGMQKLTPGTFERWMRILAGVDDSVLWLLSGIADSNARLRAMAESHGVRPDRLIFAEKRANPQHVARYALADLFLDTLPYGAHTTAADALWMGVPILTLSGRSFASRVCASLVEAAGIGELVCASPDAYVARAIELGRDPARLAAIKAKLISGRDGSLLFDEPRLVRDLEGLYRQMWSDHESGRLPVPDLRNLEIYHDIGAEIDLEALELLDEAAFQRIYQERLAAWHSVYPIRPDARMWREDGATWAPSSRVAT